MISRWGPGKWPSEAECIALMKMAGCREDVIAHTKRTASIAVAMANRINEVARDSKGRKVVAAKGEALADVDLVRAGALLHDIGRAVDQGIRHAVVGVKVARGLGLPEELINIIERHIGAGIERQEAVKFGLPAKDYFPLTLEEKIVAHADNLAGKKKKEKLEKVLADLEKKGASHAIPRMMALHRELSALCGMDLDLLEL
jgi:uncharacterized protein (TIGR00295 family)